MNREKENYEPPLMVEVGDFMDVTLRQGTWGWDKYDQCKWLC
ncbi:lasso RiPP family leader peptide-containing protein [Actinomadura sp. 1N219]